MPINIHADRGVYDKIYGLANVRTATKRVCIHTRNGNMYTVKVIKINAGGIGRNDVGIFQTATPCGFLYSVIKGTNKIPGGGIFTDLTRALWFAIVEKYIRWNDVSKSFLTDYPIDTGPVSLYTLTLWRATTMRIPLGRGILPNTIERDIAAMKSVKKS